MRWSRDARVEVQGREAQPVLVFEGFCSDPDELVEDAAMLGFARRGEHYPGVRAVVPGELADAMTAAVAGAAADAFGVRDLKLSDAFYSLVTTPPAALAPIQRLPHFDGVQPERLALLLYLSRDNRGGTAFFRQRATGFESVGPERLPAYRRALDEGIVRKGMPPPAYIAGDTPLFEEVAAHRGCWNRAILYRSNTLHCARLPAGAALSDDPAAGRLTVNLFLTGSPAG